MAAASDNTGLMGYGRHRHIHRPGLFRVSDDKPVTIIAVDSEERSTPFCRTSCQWSDEVS
jgi:PII-like signaling protein